MQRGKEQELRRALREIREAIDAYKRAGDEGAIEQAADKTGYPPTLAALVEGAVDKSDPKGASIYFLRRVPARSGDAARAVGRAQLREPAPTRPRSGDDVFDVYSQAATRRGLNGVPYKEW